ncbi:DUF4167 domain-containing protein [Brevundimonas naejangsanensis]|uniref:DUF4167 domain-containing protein n=1 Tax=Brevundimonas naejangsanensis TaxID=588932 RepID=UPI001FDED107|nr:DUF4167 domain-containing protein [Brevundimonas naejangsanensis]
MKRQRGRNRKPGGGNNANATNPNRSWDSQGPENIKVRGNAQTVYERYMQLARDAAAAGDRVLAENYTQHAEHYFRVLRALQPQRPVSEIAQRELAGQGFDIDFEDESGAQAAAIIAAQQAEERRVEDEARRQAERAEREANRDRDREGSDNGADGESREGGRRETRRERWERRREERNRRFENNEGEGDAAASGEDSAQGDDQPIESAEAPAVVEEAPVERAPRAPRAPRRARAAEDDAAQPTDDAAALPGFLTRPITAEEAASAEDEPAPTPKRRTRRKADAVAPDEEG